MRSIAEGIALTVHPLLLSRKRQAIRLMNNSDRESRRMGANKFETGDYVSTNINEQPLDYVVISYFRLSKEATFTDWLNTGGDTYLGFEPDIGVARKTR